MNILEMHDVHTHILGFHILEGVSFTIKPAKVSVLLGRNGAGKSTTMKTIMGLTPSTSGQILFKGQPIHTMRDFDIPRLGISLVPEGRDVFSNLTVEENLRIARREKW